MFPFFYNMNFNFRTFLLLAIVFSACNAKYLVAPNGQGKPGGVGVQPQTTKRALVCECGDSENLICANNGVTYKNKCKFECAQHKIDGLRMVKEGECGKYVSKLQFWSFG